MRKAKADEDAKEEGGKDAIDDDKFSVFGQYVKKFWDFICINSINSEWEVIKRKKRKT